MGDLITAASEILSGANRRAADSAQNIANMATPGYRSQKTFSALVAPTLGSGAYATRPSFSFDTYAPATPGKLLETGSPVDFALMGPGYFGLGNADERTFTRNGQFSVSEDGILVGADGRAVQDAAGGGIHLRNAPIELLEDGSILQDGERVGQIGVWDVDPSLAGTDSGGLHPVDQTNFVAIENPGLKQGYLEMSNVSLGDEMVTMMEALRWAETGQRLVNTYDDLLGRVFSTLGQST